MSTEAYVKELPNCDFCKQDNLIVDAEYDGKTVMGPWANMCAKHHVQYGTGVGTGRGQKLIVGEKPAVTDQERREEVIKALRSGDFDAFEELVGDGDPADYL